MLALLAAGTAVAAAVAWRDHRAVQSLRLQLDELRVQRAAAAAAPVHLSAPPYEASARAMLIERSLPWPQVLITVESAEVVGVTPVSIDAEAANRTLRLEVVFTDYSQLLRYVEVLNAGEPELRWVLSQSQAQGAGLATATLTGETRVRR